jgi:glycosyltransferase involved in cell wall biosynthesis
VTVSQRSLDVLITSPYYWPEPMGTAPYITGIAEYLAARGHRVAVVAGFPHYPAWSHSAARHLVATEHHAGVEIRRRMHYVPRRQSALRRALYEATLFGAGMSAIGLRRPDVVVGVTPALAGAVLAASAAKLFRRPYGLVVHDLMGSGAEQSGIAGGGWAGRLVRPVELKAIRGAARVGVIADAFKAYVLANGGDPARVVRVRTWTLGRASEEPVEVTRARLGWDVGDFVCLYAGSVGYKQGLGNLLDAARALTADGIRIVIAGEGSALLDVQREAQTLRVRNVSFLPAQPAGAYEAMLRAADILIVNQRASLIDMSLPSKLTSYFPAGRPVVAAVTPEGETAAEIAVAGAGVVVPAEQPAALAQAIRALSADPVRCAELAASGRVYAERVLSADVVLPAYEALIVAAATSGSNDP